MLDLGAMQLAQIICVLSFRYLTDISARGVLESALGGTDPKVTALISFFNFISSWVVYAVLDPSKAKNRAKSVVIFIKLAVELRRLGNYSGLTAVLAGLNSSSISRLKSTFKYVDTKTLNELIALETLMSPEMSYKNYRAEFYHARPRISYLGVLMSDLQHLNEGPDFVSNTFQQHKWNSMADAIFSDLAHRDDWYSFSVSRDSIRLFENMPITISEDQAYEKSMALEPRAVSR